MGINDAIIKSNLIKVGEFDQIYELETNTLKNNIVYSKYKGGINSYRYIIIKYK
jgi:hypothetical protein